MRKFALMAVAASAAVAVIAMPANAGSFDRHFTVLSEDVQGHEIENGFAFRSALFNPANPINRVGWSKVKCRDRSKGICKAFLHFDGSIGGFGDLAVKGNFGGGDRTLNVVDGNGSFTGAVTGKMIVEGIDRNTELLHFHLTR